MQAMFFLYPSYHRAAGFYFVSSSSSVRQKAGRAAELLEPTFLYIQIRVPRIQDPLVILVFFCPVRSTHQLLPLAGSQAGTSPPSHDRVWFMAPARIALRSRTLRCLQAASSPSRLLCSACKSGCMFVISPCATLLHVLRRELLPVGQKSRNSLNYLGSKNAAC